MSTPQQYDAIIIGSGQAGTPLSTALAACEVDTALIQRKHVGGRGIHAGCTPKLDGLDEVPTLDNVSIMELDAVPEHLLILGGGYIGVEFGQLFRRFGSRVTIVQLRGQLLAGEDPDIAEEVAKIVQQDGIEVLLNAKVIRVAQADRNIRLDVEQQGHAAPMTLVGSHLLLATGRVPNSDTLNLVAAGIQTDDRAFIKGNDRLETTTGGGYPLGGIKGGPAFNHISY